MKLLCADRRVAAIIAKNLPPDSSEGRIIIVHLPNEVNVARQMLKEQPEPKNPIRAVIAFGLDMIPTISLIHTLIDSRSNVPLLLGAGGSLGDINNPRPLDGLLEICMRVHTFETILAKLPPMEVTQ